MVENPIKDSENNDKEKKIEEEKPTKKKRVSRKASKDYQQELDELFKSKTEVEVKKILNKSLLDMRHFADLYSKMQKIRVGLELKIQSIDNAMLLKKGMAIEETMVTEVEVVDSKGNVIIQKRRGRKVVRSSERINEKEDPEEKARLENKEEKALMEFHQTSFTYKMLAYYNKEMHNQEIDIRTDAVSLLRNTEILKWCERVRGLGDVAALSFVGHIDPLKIHSVWHMLSYLGVIPGKSMRRGSQGNYNRRIKSIFVGIITPNIIRSNDPYYKELYNIKKEYHALRPDLEARKETMKGWKGYIHNMTIRFLVKILLSHAFDLLCLDYGKTTRLNPDAHRNPIPVKPENFQEQEDILNAYRLSQTKRIEQLKFIWDQDETEGKQNYFKALRNIELEMN